MARQSYNRPIRVRIPRLDKRGKSRSARGYHEIFHFPLPRNAQLAFLHLPVLKNYLVCYERQVIVRAIVRLQDGGLSFNQAARALRVPVATAFEWLKKYRAHGPKALTPKHVGRRATRGPAPCSLEFIFRT